MEDTATNGTINNIMDYMTRYYKTLSEDLQKRLNQLITEAETSVATPNISQPSAEISEPGRYDAPPQPWWDDNWLPHTDRPDWGPDWGEDGPTHRPDPEWPMSPISPADWLRQNPYPDINDPKWDSNGDGVIDEKEQTDYDNEVHWWTQKWKKILDRYREGKKVSPRLTKPLPEEWWLPFRPPRLHDWDLDWYRRHPRIPESD